MIRRRPSKPVLGLFFAAGLMLVSLPQAWFEAGALGVDLTFSALDAAWIGVLGTVVTGAYGAVGYVVWRTARQAAFLASLTVGMAMFFATAVVLLSTEIILDSLPIPSYLEDAAPSPGPGLGFVLLASTVAVASSTGGLLVRSGLPESELGRRTSDLPTVERPPTAAWADPDIPEF